MSKPHSIPEPASDEPTTLIKPARFRPPSAAAQLPRLTLHWVPLAIGSVLLLWLWVAWFVFTARAVTIEVEPGNASINVEETLAPRIGNHWLLLAGPRHVRVAAPGYTPFAGTLTVSEEQVQTHTVTLERLPGHLLVNLAPDVTATVLVDGVAGGKAPGTVHDVPAGAREIEVRAPRYRPYTTTIEIEGKGIEQSLGVVLEPAWASFDIASQPAGASVSVDQQRVGSTPLASELLEGRRLVQLTREGYKPWQQTLKVVAGTPVKLGTIVMHKADGRLHVSSTPPAASVTIDGEFVGRTPLDAALTPDKSHAVRVLAEGYLPAEQELTVPSGKSSNLTLELTPELATIQLMTDPADAELLIDGEPRGIATQTLSLPTREHQLLVRRVGYATYQTTVIPRKGVEKRFRIRLKTLQETAASARTPVPSAEPGARSPGAGPAGAGAGPGAGAGQDMKLFKGGRVVLGSSRRDAARRADEVEREVILQRPFYLAIKEVTQAQFRLFMANHHAAPVDGKQLDDDEQPAVDLSWTLAVLYCNWLSRRDGLPLFYQIKYGEVLGVNPDATGYRLPTEAEWEWAAKVPPGSAATLFAWGDTFPPQGLSGNYADATAATLISGALRNYNDGFAVAAPAGSFAPNLLGLYDMGGNVAEWVHDYYVAAPDSAPSVDPQGPPGGEQHVIKGASWAQGTVTQLRVAFRDTGLDGRRDVGFRVARYAQ